MPNVLVNDDSLKAIGNAIRGKNGETTTYKPAEMAAAITAISGGDGLTQEDLAFSGRLRQYTLADKLGTAIVENYGDLITFTNISFANTLFIDNTANLDNITINIKDLNPDCFMQNYKGKKLPKVVGNITKTSYDYCSNLFSGWHNVREIPKSFYEGINWNSSHIGMYSAFSSLYSLRTYPEELIDSIAFSYEDPMYAGYFYVFSNCYVLESVDKYPVNTNITATNNMFSNFLNFCQRLSDFTFKLDENNQPVVANWKTQTINLATNIGFAVSLSSILDYNSGITADKEVKDDASYQTLKNDPDWFTFNIAYSRYNHDSAVRTINSLPDTSAYLATAGGTNTIKFTGEAGKYTDGGAINTLTEEEIAVATAKGWTVSFV